MTKLSPKADSKKYSQEEVQAAWEIVRVQPRMLEKMNKLWDTAYAAGLKFGLETGLSKAKDNEK